MAKVITCASDDRPTTWMHLLILALACVALLTADRQANAQDYANQVLNAGDKNQRGQKAVKGRKGGIDSVNAMTVIQKEPDPDIAALVLGMYLESGKFDPGRTTLVIKAAAARKDLFAKTTLMVAICPHFTKIMGELLESKKKPDHLLAATILAVYARSVDSIVLPKEKKNDKAKKRPGGQNKHKDIASVDIDPYLTELIKVRDKNVMEMVTIAAAYARSKAVEEEITRMKPTGELLGAQFFYFGRMGKPVPVERTRVLFRSKRKTDKRYLGTGPGLSNYELRTHGAIYTCQAAGESGDAAFLPSLEFALKHEDKRVTIQAIKAMEMIGSQDSLPVLMKTLEADPRWPIKVFVLSAVGAIPNANSIEPLMEMLAKERGRFRQDFVYALSSITAFQHGKTVNEWREWWAANKATFKVDAKKTAEFRKMTMVQDILVPSLTDFYGLPIISDHLVFVLDTSASMKGEKIEVLKLNMDSTLNNLPKRVHFNVVNFGGVVHVMYEGGMLLASDAPRAGEIVQEMTLTGGTRTADAIETAFRLADLDTIIYLSDGAPVAGQWESWARIARATDLFNRYRPIAVYCIYYTNNQKKPGAKGGKKKLAGVAKAMAAIAAQNAGLMSRGEKENDAPDDGIAAQEKKLAEMEAAAAAEKAAQNADNPAGVAAKPDPDKPKTPVKPKDANAAIDDAIDAAEGNPGEKPKGNKADAPTGDAFDEAEDAASK